MVRPPRRLLFVAVRNKLTDDEGIKHFKRIPDFSNFRYIFVSSSAIKNIKIILKQ